MDRTAKIMALMFSMKRLAMDRMRVTGQRDPVSMLRLATLRVVQELDGPLMKDVARMLCITPPSATSLISGLADAGLLARHLDPKDRRTVRLRLTAKGLRTLKSEMRLAEVGLRKTFSVLSPHEQDAFIAILEKLTSQP